jgi:hypothetical protein
VKLFLRGLRNIVRLYRFGTHDHRRVIGNERDR